MNAAADEPGPRTGQDLPELELLLPAKAYPSHPLAPCVLRGPELWTADEKRHRTLAAELCLACPILAECDAAATERKERWGTWGGVDRETAYRHRETQGKPPPAACGTVSGYKRHWRNGEPACEACKASRRQGRDTS